MQMLLYSSNDHLSQLLEKNTPDLGVYFSRLSLLKHLSSKAAEDQTFCIIDQEGLDTSSLLLALENVRSLEANKTRKTFFLLLAQLKSTVSFNALIKAGIDGIIKKSDDNQAMALNILSCLKENMEVPHRRQHVRVKPRAEDKVEALIYLPEQRRYVAGKIVDLSMAAMAVALPSPVLGTLKETAIFPNCCIFLEDQSDINIHMKLVKKSDTLGAFAYVSIKDCFREQLSAYIYHKLKPAE